MTVKIPPYLRGCYRREVVEFDSKEDMKEFADWLIDIECTFKTGKTCIIVQGIFYRDKPPFDDSDWKDWYLNY